MSPRDEVLGILRECEGHMRLVSIPTAFIELTGDVASAGLLSQLLYWTSRTTNAEGWVYKSHAEWKRELGLGRCAVDRARRRLSELGVLQQTCRMANGRRTMHFRIDLAALRSAILPPTGRPESGTPESSISADRCAENRQTGLPVSRTPTTETTTETTPEITAQTTPETTAESSSERPRAEMRGFGGAPEGSDGTRDGMEGRCMETEPAKQSARQYFDVVCQRRPERAGPGKAESVTDDVLFEIIERVPGFPRERDHSRLKATLADYPGLDYAREFGRFAAYWSDSTLAHPWLALRRWLERAHREEPPSHAAEAARPFAWKRDAAGRCYAVRTNRVAPSATRR